MSYLSVMIRGRYGYVGGVFVLPVSTLILVVIFERASDIGHLALAFGVLSRVQDL